MRAPPLTSNGERLAPVNAKATDAVVVVVVVVPGAVVVVVAAAAV
jgi:hypothetical protein